MIVKYWDTDCRSLDNKKGPLAGAKKSGTAAISLKLKEEKKEKKKVKIKG